MALHDAPLERAPPPHSPAHDLAPGRDDARAARAALCPGDRPVLPRAPGGRGEAGAPAGARGVPAERGAPAPDRARARALARATTRLRDGDRARPGERRRGKPAAEEVRHAAIVDGPEVRRR